MSAPGFRFGLDGRPWSAMAERDLRAEVESGSTLKEAAGHPCHSGTKEEVAKKAEELGLKGGQLSADAFKSLS